MATTKFTQLVIASQYTVSFSGQVAFCAAAGNECYFDSKHADGLHRPLMNVYGGGLIQFGGTRKLWNKKRGVAGQIFDRGNKTIFAARLSPLRQCYFVALIRRRSH